jgi:predicted 3-demethylubiquinone-9 3-methyltransferase (glyoxalase superfamily)
MDSGAEQAFTFTEAVSFVVTCEDQDEIDYYWSKLSKDTQFAQCGWCKDQFGISWQIVPKHMDELMMKPGAFAKLMEMKKIVVDQF